MRVSVVLAALLVVTMPGAGRSSEESWLEMSRAYWCGVHEGRNDQLLLDGRRADMRPRSAQCERIGLRVAPEFPE